MTKMEAVTNKTSRDRLKIELERAERLIANLKDIVNRDRAGLAEGLDKLAEENRDMAEISLELEREREALRRDELKARLERAERVIDQARKFCAFAEDPFARGIGGTRNESRFQELSAALLKYEAKGYNSPVPADSQSSDQASPENHGPCPMCRSSQVSYRCWGSNRAGYTHQFTCDRCGLGWFRLSTELKLEQLTSSKAPSNSSTMDPKARASVEMSNSQRKYSIPVLKEWMRRQGHIGMSEMLTLFDLPDELSDDSLLQNGLDAIVREIEELF